eukprot:jgi/Undpi1/8044/HiC_scaffold_24.g10516.m1
MAAGGADLPRFYHDVIGVAVIIADEGSPPQEAFRYPFWNKQTMCLFDRISPESLTQLLKANRALSGELLEIVLDGLRFISRPVQLTPKRGDHLRTAAFFDLVFAVVSEYRPPRLLYPSAPLPKNPPSRKMPPVVTTTGVVAGTGVAASNSPALVESMPDPVTVSFFGDVEGEVVGSVGVGVGGGAGGGEGRREEEEGRERGPGVDLTLLRSALMMTSRAICHEEELNGFITKSGKELLAAKDNRDAAIKDIVTRKLTTSEYLHCYNGAGFIRRGLTLFGGNISGDIGGGDGNVLESVEKREMRAQAEWRETVMEEHQMAQDLRTLFEGLTSDAPFEMTIKKSSGLSINVTTQRKIPDARRYETLLLREEKHIVLAGHPRDGSPQVRKLIETANPHQTFEEMAYASETDLSQMLRLARHMVFWGDGRVIDALCGTNRYMMTRAAMRASMPFSPVMAEFSAKFPKRLLIEELTRFGENRPLSEIMDGARKSQRYIVLSIPEPSSHPFQPESASAASNTNTNTNTNANTNTKTSPTNTNTNTNTSANTSNTNTNTNANANTPNAAPANTNAHTYTAPSTIAEEARSATGGAVEDISPRRRHSEGGGINGGGGSIGVAGVGGGGGVGGGVGVGGRGGLGEGAAVAAPAAGGAGGGAGGASYGSNVGSNGVEATGYSRLQTPSLEPFEEEYLRSRDDGSETGKLMRRLAPFFRGKLSFREVVWRLDIVDPQAVEHLLKSYSDILVETWRPERDAEPEFDA